MGTLRKDYILDRWVYYATDRKKRPHDFKSVESKEKSKFCFFCPSNEHLTPEEIGRLEYKNDWKMRWFLNKFPAIEQKGKPFFKSKKFFFEGNAYGIHEVIVETRHHKSQLADLPVNEIGELFEIYKFRISYLSKTKGIKYISVFKNFGKDAGTSLEHSHSQVVALPQVPSLVQQECDAAKKFKKCPYCDIIKLESKSKRNIFETENVIAIAPYASMFNYETHIFVKKHKRTFDELEENELKDLAKALKLIIVKLKSINASYNYYVHYSPKNEDLHFHIEVTPRTALWGGFELGTGCIINSVMPEDAAKFYRGKS